MHLPALPGVANRRMLSILDEGKLRRILARMLDEKEFYGPHGIRALSRSISTIPTCSITAVTSISVAYVPGDSDTGMFGGNSNWRGPVWMPVNYLLYTRCCGFTPTTAKNSRSNVRRVPGRCSLCCRWRRTWASG